MESLMKFPSREQFFRNLFTSLSALRRLPQTMPKAIKFFFSENNEGNLKAFSGKRLCTCARYKFLSYRKPSSSSSKVIFNRLLQFQAFVLIKSIQTRELAIKLAGEFIAQQHLHKAYTFTTMDQWNYLV